MHRPLVQIMFPFGHAWPQPPQLWVSVLGSTQTPPQLSLPLGHVHIPFTQVIDESGHGPQPPQ